MPKTIAIIPARGGSKRLTRKNIRPLGGFPLLMYSIAAAKNCSHINDFIVSTDDDAIAAVALQCQAKVLRRNPDFAQDHSSLLEVVGEVLQEAEKRGESFDQVLILQPTSPLRTQDFLAEGFALFGSRPDASSVIAVGKEKIFSGEERDGFFHYTFSKNARSQDLKDTCIVAGSFYLLRVDQTLKKGSLLGDHMVAYVTDDEHALIDIDEHSDFELAQHALASHQDRFRDFFDFGRRIFYPPRSIAGKKMKIAGLTTCRSDFGIMKHVFKTLEGDSAFDFHVLATGSHFDPNRGNTFSEVKAAGFKQVHSFEIFSEFDQAGALSQFSSRLFQAFGDFFSKHNFDCLVLMGDRAENLPIVGAALLHRIPIAHVHGGEVTEGAIDEMVRHALTKMAHVHFVAHNDFARRVAQLGEEPWRIHISGSPALDDLKQFSALSKEAFLKQVGLDRSDFILVTLHPETADLTQWKNNVAVFFAALKAFDLTQNLGWLLTFPGPDAGSQEVIHHLQAFVKDHPHAVLHRSLGRELYGSALTHARVMVGNSSSGLIESANFGIPVVNVGSRQKGRPEPANVYTVDFIEGPLLAALKNAWDRPHRIVSNPYQKGDAAQAIAAVLRTLPEEFLLLRKGFLDW